MSGNEPVREWLINLSEANRRVVGQDLYLLHAFIKKAQKTPAPDLETARKRQKEVENG